MDDQPVTIELDGSPRIQDQPLNFSAIHNTYDDTKTIDDLKPNSVTVKFNETVELHVVQIFPTDGSSLEDVSIVIRKKNPDGSLDYFVDGDGNPVAEYPIPLTNNQVILPDDLPYAQEFVIIVVSTSESQLEVTIEFRGCVHPGMHV